MRPIRPLSPFVVLLALAALAGLLAPAPASLALGPVGDHPDALAPAGAPQDEQPPDEQPPVEEPEERDAEEEAEPEDGEDEESAEEGDDAEAGENEGDEGDEDDEKWDVTVPPGPASEVTIDVRRGTWMSLDLSPDGGTLAFDLLGDLYTLAVAGCEAVPVTAGFAWDMQPRWSPDGRSIAFTSDRSGGDNVWVVRRGDEGAWGEPEQVTEEKFRLVNSPAWSPDGE
jgi:hypothetical protein